MDESERAPIDCPKCAVRMETLTVGSVEIDRCPTCRGIWLDLGERDKLIERKSDARQCPRSSRPTATPTPRT